MTEMPEKPSGEPADRSEKADALAALYRLSREFRPWQPAWRQLIDVIGREAKHWWSRPVEPILVEAEVTKDIRLVVDLQDRYGFNLANGLITEATDFALFRRMAGEVKEIWDIGANVGLYTIAGAQGLAAGRGRVVAFEPNPPVFDLLTRNIEANNLTSRITPYRHALSDQRAKRAFHACRDTAFSGLEATNRSPEVGVIDLETHRLDDVWREEGARPIELLKIDVEGHEQAVLAGAREALAASPDLVIQMEVSRKNHQTGGHEDSAWLAELCQEAFTAHSFDDTLAETVIEGDFLRQARDGNLFLCRRDGKGADRLRAAVRAERQARAASFAASPLLNGIQVLLDLIEQNRGERNALKMVKDNLERRCQELADKVHYHADLERRCQELADKVRSHEPLERRCQELADKVRSHEPLERRCLELEEKVRAHEHLERRCQELADKLRSHEHLERRCQELADKVQGRDRVVALLKARLEEATDHENEVKNKPEPADQRA